MRKEGRALGSNDICSKWFATCNWLGVSRGMNVCFSGNKPTKKPCSIFLRFTDKSQNRKRTRTTGIDACPFLFSCKEPIHVYQIVKNSKRKNSDILLENKVLNKFKHELQYTDKIFVWWSRFFRVVVWRQFSKFDMASSLSNLMSLRCRRW